MKVEMMDEKKAERTVALRVERTVGKMVQMRVVETAVKMAVMMVGWRVV